MADRNRDDDDDDRPRKKRPAPRDDDDDEDRPRKKSRPRDEDDDEDDRPKRKRPRYDEDEEENEGDDVGNSPLGAVVPLGVSIWALLSLYSALLCFIPGSGLLAILFGILAFATHKHKATYGSISGNMRAVMGILIGLATVVLQIIFAIVWLKGMR